MKNVMSHAWEIAREGAALYGGKSRDYFAESLCLAWAEAKKPSATKARFDLSGNTRKTRTWIARIVGKHPAYKFDREFINEDMTDIVGDKVFFLTDGYYDVHNGNKRRVSGGKIQTVDAREINILEECAV